MTKPPVVRRTRSPFVAGLLRMHQIVAMNSGADPMLLWHTLRNLPGFVRDLRAYRARSSSSRFSLRVGDLFPVLGDRTSDAGTASGHYFHQDLWAARHIYRRRPAKHLDVGSAINGFVAHVLVFMPVTVIDVRPLSSQVPGLTFHQDDATSLRSIQDETIPSLSCLHAAEHFGLGRYGDPIDPDAPFKLMRSLSRVLAPGGRLYFGVPIGRERLEFNAHRVFSPRTILEAFPDLELVSFSAVDDAGDLHGGVAPEDFEEASYACGLFELTKRGAAQ
jgi:SAM-dependent methyltransferase